MSYLPFIIIGLINLAILIVVIILLTRGSTPDFSPLHRELEAIAKAQDETVKSMREEMSRLRMEAGQSSRDLREELQTNLNRGNQNSLGQLAESSKQQKNQLDSFSIQLLQLTKMNEQKFELARATTENGLAQMRTTLESQLKSLQEENAAKLEQMRATVDEKLHVTLEKRLGESFSLVSERLEAVQSGLGEMRSLAAGVGDLKRVLGNVKARGLWGEISLGNIIAEILLPEQYEMNVATKKNSKDRVEYAVKMPGRDAGNADVLWLPIDAKFPQEDFQRLVDAHERGDQEAIKNCHEQLAKTIKVQAKNIHDKYIDPPQTTDFGIMFLPTESLFAEVLSTPGLHDELLHTYRVCLAGPTTLAALLNSLSMGFKTLAIQQRSSEVWMLLGAVKTEFEKFGGLLDNTAKKLQAATNEIEAAQRKSRTIERKLKKVQELPTAAAAELVDADEEAESEDNS